MSDPHDFCPDCGHFIANHSALSGCRFRVKEWDGEPAQLCGCKTTNFKEMEVKAFEKAIEKQNERCTCEPQMALSDFQPSPDCPIHGDPKVLAQLYGCVNCKHKAALHFRERCNTAFCNCPELRLPGVHKGA